MAGAGLTALGDTRLSDLDSAVSSRSAYAVAAVAIGLHAHATQRRWRYCRDAAAFYGIMAELWRGEIDTLPSYGLCGTFMGSMTDAEQKQFLARLPALPTAAEHRAACLRAIEHH